MTSTVRAQQIQNAKNGKIHSYTHAMCSQFFPVDTSIHTLSLHLSPKGLRAVVMLQISSPYNPTEF